MSPDISWVEIDHKLWKIFVGQIIQNTEVIHRAFKTKRTGGGGLIDEA